MLTAIDFNRKATFHADKIHHVITDRMLLPKTMAGELTHSKMAPQPLFRFGQIAA